jgi:hypothetical protein
LWNAMAFGQRDAWHDELDLLDVVYSVVSDPWRGSDTMRMIIKDFRPAEGSSVA